MNQRRSARPRAARGKLYEFTLRAYTALVYLFLFLPVATIFVYSFNDSDVVLVWDGFTSRWYGEAFDDLGFREGVQNSIVVAAATGVIAVSLGTLLAIGLSAWSRWVQVVAGLVMVMTLTVPEVLVGLSALVFFDSIGLTLGIHTIVAAHAAFGISLVGLLVRARLATLGPTYEEASADLGAGPWRTFTQITVPLASPAILAGGLLAFTFSFDNFVIAFFTSGPGSQTLPIRIWGQIRFGVTPIANAVGSMVVTFGVILVALALVAFRWRSRRIGESTDLLAGSRMVQEGV